MGGAYEIETPSGQPAEGFSVCSKCFGDHFIQAFILSSAQSYVCDFCGRKTRSRATAAPLDEVFEFILLAIGREYERAVDALGWNGAEGGFQGKNWDSHELLEDVIGIELPRDDGRLLDILVKCLGDEQWCERDPYALRPDERLIGSWTDFCEFIKHKRRYFFMRQSARNLLAAPEYLSPSELLGFIGDAVQEHSLICELPEGSLIYRARQQKPGQIFRTPSDFGPPPVSNALRSNRMSPAGIVMFYGSSERETAIAEIDDNPQLGIVVGTFRTMRKSRVLDLTRLPRRLGFFEQQSDSSTVDRYALDFLHNFVKSLAAKVAPGEREHIDYVPTQVVTEWFRSSFQPTESPLDGIWYPSSQLQKGRSVVLFSDRYDVILSPRETADVAAAEGTEEWWVRTRHQRAWLKLMRKRVVRSPGP